MKKFIFAIMLPILVLCGLSFELNNYIGCKSLAQQAQDYRVNHIELLREYWEKGMARIDDVAKKEKLNEEMILELKNETIKEFKEYITEVDKYERIQVGVINQMISQKQKWSFIIKSKEIKYIPLNYEYIKTMESFK